MLDEMIANMKAEKERLEKQNTLSFAIHNKEEASPTDNKIDEN